MGDLKRRKGKESLAKHVNGLYFLRQQNFQYETGWRAGRNVLCIIMRSLEYKSLYIIYLLKNWCTGGMLSYCVAVFPSCVILGLGFFFFSSIPPGENKSIPNFLPLVSLLHWKLPLKLVPFYRKESRSLLSTPWSSLIPTLPPPDLAGVLHFPCQSSSPGNLFTLRRCLQGQGGWAS